MVPLSNRAASAILLGMATPIVAATLALAAAGCSTSSRSGANSGGTSGPCDPLAPTPVTLGTILGVGQDPQSALYVADQAPDAGQNRVFVSSGSTLVRKHVGGSGQTGGPPDADYSFSFQDPFADASTARALLIQVRGGAVTAMALGPPDSKSFYVPDAGDAPLTVLDAGAAARLKIQNLPVLVEYVADVSDGNAVVVTQPMDPWGYSDYRLFYGTANQMVERRIAAYNRGDTGDDIAFTVDAATYTAHFTWQLDDGGGVGAPGPASLDTTGGTTLPMTQRVPTPNSLTGFSFSCLGS
jgi:hypothetical protein